MASENGHGIKTSQVFIRETTMTLLKEDKKSSIFSDVHFKTYNFTCNMYILHGLQGALVREHGTATSQEDSASGRGTVASPVHRHETFLRITHNILCRWHWKIKQ